MAYFRTRLLLLFFASLALSLSVNAQSEDWLRKSIVELHMRSEVPGAVLEPGRYVFRLMDVDDHRKVVEILDQQQSQILATFAAVPDHRMRPDSEAPVRYFDGGDEKAAVIRTWYWDTDLDGFPQNEMIGYEFVYPAARARELVQRVDDYVLATGSFGGVITAMTQNGATAPIVDAMPRTARAKLHAQIEAEGFVQIR